MFCSQCGNAMSEGQAYCPSCGMKADAQPAAGAERERTAWEDRQRIGFFRSLGSTLAESLFHPVRFFRRMAVRGGLSDPLLYGMIVSMAGITAFYAWQTLLQETMPFPESFKGAAGLGHPSGAGLGVIAIIAPFAIIANLFLWAGMLHLLLLAVRGSRNGFEATFRVIAYSSGTSILLAVPFCGWPLAMVWNLALAIIGLKEGQGTSGGKASFAVLFPLLLCCAAAAIFTMLFLGTVAAALGPLSHQPWK